MTPTRLSLVLATAFLTAAPAQASTYVSVFNFSWTGTWSFSGDGSPDADGLWGITASSEFINLYEDDPTATEKFDPAKGAYRVEGRVDIIGGLGSSFTGADVIGLSLEVISTDNYRIASYSIAKDDLRIGIMNGTIVDDGLGNGSAELTAFRLMQRVDPGDPTQKFEQIFGCPTIQEGCGTGSYMTPMPSYGSGNPVPPSGFVSSYGVVVLTDGRRDPCCAARVNTLRFHYETPELALASFRLTWDRDNSYTLEGPPPEGLPSPIPLPAALPLLLGALGFLGLAAGRRGRASSAKS